MRSLLAAISFLIIMGATIPYIADIFKGRVRPARSTRCMFVLLLVVSLIQQKGLGSGWSLSLTIAEVLSAIVLLFLSFKRGIGGLRRLDVICYGLLLVDLLIWFFTKNALVALHLSIVADTVAFWPVLHKTWFKPASETKIFYYAGVIAPLFSMVAETHPSYQTLVFPAYISLVNGIELILIYNLLQ